MTGTRKMTPSFWTILHNHMAELARLIKQERVIDEVPSPLPKLHVKNKR